MSVLTVEKVNETQLLDALQNLAAKQQTVLNYNNLYLRFVPSGDRQIIAFFNTPGGYPMPDVTKDLIFNGLGKDKSLIFVDMGKLARRKRFDPHTGNLNTTDYNQTDAMNNLDSAAILAAANQDGVKFALGGLGLFKPADDKNAEGPVVKSNPSLKG